jgi:transcriptional regulator with PAS, ATPase and Fis domain
MTEKETNTEMLEIFRHKHALTEKINHNSAVTNRYEIAAERETNQERQKEYKAMVAKGKKLISNQVSERNKLTSEKIGKQLGLSKATIIYRYRVFAGSPL